MILADARNKRYSLTMQIKIFEKIDKKILIGFLAAYAVFLTFLSLFLFFSLSAKKNSAEDGQIKNKIPTTAVEENLPTPLSTTQPDTGYNLLLLGQGGDNHSGGGLTDSIMIARLDPDKKKAVLISLPRDIWVSGEKINAAYSKGGFQSSKQAAETVIGLWIQYAVLVDFDNFVKAINSLGGINVNVPKTFDDYFYPVKGKEEDACSKTPEEIAALTATLSGFQLEKQFLCRYEHIHFDAGKNPLDGVTALKFVRSRHSDQHGGDFSRGERQQAVILGIKDKLLTLGGLKKAPVFFDQLKGFVKTDLDQKTLKTLVGLITDPKEYQIIQIGLSDQNVLNPSTGPGNQYILIPKAGQDNWTETQNYIKEKLKD